MSTVPNDRTCFFYRETNEEQICLGRKECDVCSCGGDETKCCFYPHVRFAAKKLRQQKCRIWTDDEYMEVNLKDPADIAAAMRFKSMHIKAKADPELFEAVASYIEETL